MNQGIGLNLDHQWSDRLKSSLNLSRSTYDLTSEKDFSIVQNYSSQPNIPERERAFSAFDLENKIAGIRIDLKNEWQLADSSTITFGYTFTRDETEFALVNATRAQTDTLGNSSLADQQIGYGEWRKTLLEGTFLKAGISATHYDNTNKWYLSPRVQLNQKLSATSYLKASWSQYNQFLRQLTHENYFGEQRAVWLLSDEINIPVAQATHWMLGGNHKSGAFEFDIELYYKNLKGVVDYAILMPGFTGNVSGLPTGTDFRLFFGEGISKGIDFMVKRNGQYYTSWLSYTLSKTEQTFEMINQGNPIPGQDDRRHQLKWVNIWEKDNWSFAANYIFATGDPYLNLDQLNNDRRDRRASSFDAILARNKAYHRMDVSAYYSFKINKLKARFGGSVYNLLDFRNVRSRQFLFSLPERDNRNSTTLRNRVIGTEFEMLGRILNLEFKMAF